MFDNAAYKYYRIPIKHKDKLFFIRGPLQPSPRCNISRESISGAGAIAYNPTSQSPISGTYHRRLDELANEPPVTSNVYIRIVVVYVQTAVIPPQNEK
jgi:hypothetical protein